MSTMTAKQARQHCKNLREHIDFAAKAMGQIVEDLGKDIDEKEEAGVQIEGYEWNFAIQIENAESAAIDAMWHLHRAEEYLLRLPDDTEITGGET